METNVETETNNADFYLGMGIHYFLKGYGRFRLWEIEAEKYEVVSEESY